VKGLTAFPVELSSITNASSGTLRWTSRPSRFMRLDLLRWPGSAEKWKELVISALLLVVIIVCQPCWMCVFIKGGPKVRFYYCRFLNVKCLRLSCVQFIVHSSPLFERPVPPWIALLYVRHSDSHFGQSSAKLNFGPPLVFMSQCSAVQCKWTDIFGIQWTIADLALLLVSATLHAYYKHALFSVSTESSR